MVLFILCPVKRALAGQKAWKALITTHTIIRYQTEADLKEFDKKIVYPPQNSFIAFLSGGDSGNLKKRLRKKIDILFRRVQEILDMRKRVKKVLINVYPNSRQLQGAYQGLYRRKGHLRAWYVYKTNTIYIQVNDMYAGMLAHEMAHAIIDHNLLVAPPDATAEILARYVDAHLND